MSTKAALVLLALCPCLAAQEQPPAKGATPPPPLLRLSTTWHDVAWQVVRLLPAATDIDLPEVEAGQQLTLIYTGADGAKVQAEPAQGLALDLDMRPRRLKQVLREGWKTRNKVIGSVLHGLVFTMLNQKLRAEPRYLARAMKGVTSFPDQIERLSLQMRAREDLDKGWQIDIELAPHAGSWLHRVVLGLEPSEQGAHLMRTPDAALSLAAAAKGAGVQELIRPFAENLANLRGQSKAERKAFHAVIRERIPQFDGSFSVLIDGPGRYVRLVGLSQPKQFARLAAQDSGLAFDNRRVGRPSAQVDERLPEALEQSGLKILAKDVDFLETMTDEAVHESELSTFVGVVRDFSLKVRWPRDGVEMARLIERIQRQRLRRLALRERALLVAELNFGTRKLRKSPRIAELREELGNMFDGDAVAGALAALPEQIRLRVAKKGADGAEKLHLQILTRTR